MTVEAGKVEMRRLGLPHRLRLPRRQFRSVPIGQRQSNQRIQLDFGNGITSSAAAVDSVLFAGPGNYNVTLTTTISDQVLSQISLSTTAGGGWDDGWSPSPTPILSSVMPAAATCTPPGLPTIRIPTPGLASTSFVQSAVHGHLLGRRPLPRGRLPRRHDVHPAGPGTADINADPSYGSLTILLQTAVSTTDTSQVVVNGPLPGIEGAQQETPLWPWVRPHRLCVVLGRQLGGRWSGFSVCSATKRLVRRARHIERRVQRA